MECNVALHEPDFSANSDRRANGNAQLESRQDIRSTSVDSGHASGTGGSSNHQQVSHETRTESVATAVGNHSDKTEVESIDKIETAPTNDGHGSNDHHPTTLTETVKKAKKKLYLHHRNQKALDKQFTAGSVFKHLPFHHHGATDEEKADHQLSPQDSHATTVWQNFMIMFTTFPYWNMAFWSGWCYSIGSALFVMDGCWSWVPTLYPETEFKGQTEYGVPLLFFFGACLYQVGGVMAYLEAINDGSFAGAAMKRLLEGHEDIERELLDAKLHTFFGHLVPHHHHDDVEFEQPRQTSGAAGENNWDSLVKNNSSPEDLYDEAKEQVERRGGVDQGPKEEKGEMREYLTWQWWPTLNGLKTYHLREIGYLACTIQLFGVTLYGVTSIVILPGIFSSLVWWQELAAYWIPQVIASCCFLIASVMFTIMAQDRWYQPKAHKVSWWIGIHAIIGSVGFL